MNNNCSSDITDKDKEESNEGLLGLNKLEKENEKKEEFEEENLVSELNDIAILSTSKLTLRQTSKKDNIIDSKKSRFEILFEKLPLKGFILAVICAFINSITSILTKLVTELSGKYTHIDIKIKKAFFLNKI